MTDEDLIVDLNRLFWLLEEDRQYLARANTARLAARRIEAQAAEIERLRVDLAKAVEERDEALNQLDSARHSVDVLEKRVAKLMGANP
jgi:chromosome segregation ATPase